MPEGDLYMTLPFEVATAGKPGTVLTAGAAGKVTKAKPGSTTGVRTPKEDEATMGNFEQGKI